MKYFRILFSAAALLLAASCIDNDVPYPVVELRIAGVEGSGFTVSGHQHRQPHRDAYAG